MGGRHPILHTLRESASALDSVLDANRDRSRNVLGDKVCEAFGFFDARGRTQRASCLRALRTLVEEERITLPPPQGKSPYAPLRTLSAPVPEAKDVPSDVREVRDLTLLLVQSAWERAIWNTLLDREHPLGTTRFAGAQVKYLVHSAHGYLGAVGFSAAALYLKPRDRWITWSHAQRERDLHHVVNLSRFLIRPCVSCRYLASHVLGRVLRRLAADFRARYSYAPYLVETFVGPDYEGTCFKAAHFRYLGDTQGRGRHADTNACTRPKKKVFVHELDPKWRAKLDVPYVELRPRLEVGAGLDSDTWAAQEFGRAELGDKRRTARLVRSAALVAHTLGRPVTAGPKRDIAAVRGFWRFIEKADQFGITPAKILAPHRERTVERMRTQDVVLCVQDGTDISFSTRPMAEGLEVIGRNQTSAASKGVHLHATIALNGEGLPLGVLRCAFGKKRKTKRLWIGGLRDVDYAVQTLPRKTQVLCVMDREADIFALFAAQRTLKRTHVLVRARHNRRLGDERLFKVMRKGPQGGVMELSVARLSRRGKSGRITHEGRPKRNARMEMRYRQVTLPPPQGSTEAPVKVSAIHLREIAPPEGAQRIEWYLLTTAAVTSQEQAMQVVEYYTLRWRVEDIYRILKSGCRVEKLRMQRAEDLYRVLTLHMVSAWRIMLMTLLGRETADMKAEVIFTEAELYMMKVYARNYGVDSQTDLRSAILLVAMMGGYMNRKHDPPPGHTIMWRGYASLQMRAMAYEELAYCDLVVRPPP